MKREEHLLFLCYVMFCFNDLDNKCSNLLMISLFGNQGFETLKWPQVLLIGLSIV